MRTWVNEWVGESAGKRASEREIEIESDAHTVSSEYELDRLIWSFDEESLWYLLRSVSII